MSSRTITKISVADSIPEWEAQLESELGSASTVRAYIGYIRRLDRVCSVSRKGLMVCDIHTGHIADVFNSYGTDQHASRNQLLVAVRAWLKWCVRRRFVDRDDADDALAGRKRVKYEPAPRYRMPEDRIPEALEVAGKSHQQRRAVVAMTLSTLARESEVSFIRLEKLDLEARTVLLYRVKTRRWTLDRFDPYWFTELMDWLSWYATDQGFATPEEMIKAHPEWYLIPRLTAHGGTSPNAYKKIHPDMPYKRMEYVVKYVLDEMGIETPGGNGDSVTHMREGMHMLRRSGARAMLKHLAGTKGNDQALMMVKAKLNHKDIRQTLTYIGVDEERDFLNEYLVEETMYGFAVPDAAPPSGAQVLPFGSRSNGKHVLSAVG